MNAIYDLSRYPANFNFVEFLVAAATRGADHIVFDRTNGLVKKYPDVQAEVRIQSILEPACALAGCSFEHGTKKQGIDTGYHISAVLKAFDEFGKIKKLTTVLPPKEVRYTVTLRNMIRCKERNSNKEEWLRFAKQIGAHVIEDWFDKPIHLHERMAYYAGAKMNYFVANGPGILCECSDYPYTVFLKGISKNYHEQCGWYKRDLPFAASNQHVLWGEDTYDNMIKAHESFGHGS